MLRNLLLMAEDVWISKLKVTLLVFAQTSQKFKKVNLEMNTGFDRVLLKIKL
jgi:hypothetical protein